MKKYEICFETGPWRSENVVVEAQSEKQAIADSRKQVELVSDNPVMVWARELVPIDRLEHEAITDNLRKQLAVAQDKLLATISYSMVRSYK
jgi:hypothetical protein